LAWLLQALADLVGGFEMSGSLEVGWCDASVESSGTFPRHAHFLPPCRYYTAFMPHRLELKDGQDLCQWLVDILSKKSG